MSAAWRGGRLTQQLLAFARQQRLESAWVDVNGLIAGMDALLHHTLSGLVQQETDLAADLWRCLIDPTQLQNALLNLAINARDAMAGSGRLTIRTANVSTRRSTTATNASSPGIT